MTGKRLYKLGTPFTVMWGAGFFVALVWCHPPAWLEDVLLLLPLAFMGMATVAKPGQLVEVGGPGPVIAVGLAIAAVMGIPLGFHTGQVWHVTDIRYPLLAFGVFLLACSAYGFSASPNSVPKVSRLSAFIQRANARRSPEKPLSKVGLALSAAIGVIALWNYTYAVFTVVDEQLDRSPPKLFQPLVLAKHKSGLRFRSYNVELSSWGPFSDARQIDVEPKVYDALKVGNRTCISLHQGFLAAQWYEVARCPYARDAS